MTGAFVCKQCKSPSPPRSARSTPSGRSHSSSRLSAPKRRCPEKPIYVAADPSEQACIVVGAPPSCGAGGSAVGEGGGAGGISLRFPTSTNKLSVTMPDLSQYAAPGTSKERSNCIQIMGDSIIRTSNGGLQIVPCKTKGGEGGSGGVRISLVGGGPILQFGGVSSSCGSRGSGGGGSGGESGKLQLSFGKGKCGHSSITCGPGCTDLEISYGPQKRKLNMNHCKPTVTSMIHKRIVELETEMKRADCPFSCLNHK